MLKRFSLSLLLSFSCVFFYANQTFAQNYLPTTVSDESAETDSEKNDTVTVERKRFEVGVQFTSLMRDGDGDRNGFGGRIGYDFATFGGGKYVATAEAEVNYLPGDRYVSDFTSFNGLGSRRDGRVAQGFFGAKVGRKFENFGVFAKARPGFVHYTRGFQNISGTGSNSRLETKGATNAALDAGGVLEFYPTKRITTRFDAGDTIVRFGKQNVNGLDIFNFPQTVPVVRPSETKHNFQFGAGIGFKF